MGRKSEGLKIRWRNGIATARFTHDGREYAESTGLRDPVAAATKAASIYARIVRGEGRPVAAVAEPSTLPLSPLTAEWIADFEATHRASTAHQYDLVAAKWSERWATLVDAARTDAVADYQRDRLHEVVRSTVKKNLSYLRGFFDWCVERRYLERAPDFPKLPRRATGTRKIVRPPRTARSEQQIAKIIRALPQWSSNERRSDAQRYRVRDRATFLYETALRPATIALIARPEHWAPGKTTLRITADIDKVGRAREVPLSTKARGAIARCAQTEGLVFGAHELDDYLEAACTKAKVPRITTYDLKHSRITSWIKDGRDLAGISHLTGVDVDTLAEHYIHPDVAAAKRVLRRAG